MTEGFPADLDASEFPIPIRVCRDQHQFPRSVRIISRSLMPPRLPPMRAETRLGPEDLARVAVHADEILVEPRPNRWFPTATGVERLILASRFNQASSVGMYGCAFGTHPRRPESGCGSSNTPCRRTGWGEHIPVGAGVKGICRARHRQGRARGLRDGDHLTTPRVPTTGEEKEVRSSWDFTTPAGPLSRRRRRWREPT